MRYFFAKNGATVIEKQAFTGDDSKADAAIANYLSTHPGLTAQETNQATFDSTNVVIDPIPSRTTAVDLFMNDPQATAKVERAVILTIIDELNNIRQWLTALKAANNTATTYATLKTGISGLSNMPDRTSAQAKTAVQNKITAGDAD